MKKRRHLLLAALFILAAFLNIIAWQSPSFCDFYVKAIHPAWVNTYARFMGIFPFSVGEFMLAAGFVATAAALLSAIMAAAFAASGKGPSVFPRARKWCKAYLMAYTWGFGIVAVVMTLNCSIPYHCSTLEERYGILGKEEAGGAMLKELLAKEYTLEELSQLRDYVVIKVNELAQLVERDGQGNILYPENMDRIAIESMQRLGEQCGQLKGYYPPAKKLTFSGFFSQQNIKGYFFPFSMEANYNGMMYEINRPATICHEYAHLKGFMYEEEANMIGFLACINSSDITFRYSGYLSVLNYVNNEFYDAIGRDKEVYASHVPISPQAAADNIFLEEAAWEKVEEKAIISTEVVDKVSDQFTEAALTMNGVDDGMLSYTRVVELLLRYYDDSPEVLEALGEREYLVQSE